MKTAQSDLPETTPFSEAVVRVIRAELDRQRSKHSAFNGVLGNRNYVTSRLGLAPSKSLTLVELEAVCERLGLDLADVVARAALRVAGGAPLPPSWPEERPARQPEWGGDGAPASDTP